MLVNNLLCIIGYREPAQPCIMGEDNHVLVSTLVVLSIYSNYKYSI